MVVVTRSSSAAAAAGPIRATHTASQEPAKRRHIAMVLALVFGIAAAGLYAAYATFPELPSEQSTALRAALSWQGLVSGDKLTTVKLLSSTLQEIKENHFAHVLALFMLTYIFLQTFAVPGSVFLSILAGTLFPFPLALALVCVCSATGASFCYLLSRQLGRQLVERAFPERLATWRAQVDRHRDNLFYYLFFLRVTPFVPNWFINAASPLIDMPLITFASSTFFGVIPLSLFHIQGGKLLNELTTTTPPLSAFLLSGGLGLIALLPTLFKNKLKERMD